jgi:beta-galactosidase
MSMTMIWGQSFGDLRIVGYFNGEAVIEKRLSKDGVPARLELVADFDELQADGMDMTAVTVRFVDSFGNTLPYAMSPVTFALQGDARFIGENPLTPPGGQAAVYVRAGVTAGVVTLTAHAGRLTAQATITLV